VNGRLSTIAAILLALAAGLASAWVAERVYERIPHIEDEYAFLWEAEVMAQGRIKLPSPEPSASFLVPFVVDHEGMRFGKYPPGWPALLSLGARFDGTGWVNPTLAALAAWLVYRLGSRLAGPGNGLLAASLTVSSPMFLMLSGSLMSHTFSLILTLAFGLAWLDLFPLREATELTRRVPESLLLGVAGSSLGLLALTRPLTALAVLVPFSLCGVYRWFRGRAGDRRRLLILAALAGTLGMLLPLWQAALSGDPWRNPYTLWWAYDRLGFGPGIGVTRSGHSLHLAYWNTRFSLRAGLHDLFGWPYLSWIFLPFGLFALRRHREAWLVLALFPALVLGHAFYWVGAWLYGPRYYFEALPGLAVASASGFCWLGGWQTKEAWRGRLRRPLVGALLMVLLILNGAFYMPPRLRMMGELNGASRGSMAPLLAAELDQALVIVHPKERWTEYGTLLTLGPPFSERNVLLAHSRGPTLDAELIRENPDRRVYHYYPDEPGRLYAGERPGD
jgi:hypothetical protein